MKPVSFHLSLLLPCLMVQTVQAELTEHELHAFRSTHSAACTSDVTVHEEEDMYVITSSGLPDHPWHCVNEHVPEAQSYRFEIPRRPVIAEKPSCVEAGPIGIAKNGVPIHSPVLDSHNLAHGQTARRRDVCGGFTDHNGRYQYNRLPTTAELCPEGIYDPHSSEPQFLGVALDGFPIYSEWSEQLSLDECHGTRLPDGRYAYIAVSQLYPYTIGCFRGHIDRPAGTCHGRGTQYYLCECDAGEGIWRSYCDTTCDLSECTAACPVTRDQESRISGKVMTQFLNYLFPDRISREKRSVSPRLLINNRTSDAASCHDLADYALVDGMCKAELVEEAIFIVQEATRVRLRQPRRPERTHDQNHEDEENTPSHLFDMGKIIDLADIEADNTYRQSISDSIDGRYGMTPSDNTTITEEESVSIHTDEDGELSAREGSNSEPHNHDFQNLDSADYSNEASRSGSNDLK